MPTPVPDRFRRVAGRVSWTLVDQVLSALSNFLLSILVARTVDADSFGAFSTAFLIFTLVIGITRATVGQPLQITFASVGPRRFRSALRYALGAAVAIGLALGAACVIVGLILGGSTGVALLTLGVCLPGLLAQDICRMAFFSGGFPARAAAIDALWAGLLFPALLLGQLLGLQDIVWPLVFWGAAALVAALVGLRMLRAEPRLPGSLRWTWQQRGLTGYLLAEYVLTSGIAQLGILAVAMVGDEAGVGALRATQVLLGPLGILGSAAFLFAVPEIARRPDMSVRARSRLCLAIIAVMGGLTAVYCAVVLLLPDGVGRALLGDTWTGAQSVLLPMCVLSMFASLATGPAATLYGMGRARQTFGIQVFKAPLLLVLMLVGVPIWGATGAAWAIAITEVVLLPVWLWRVRSVLRAEERAGDGPAGAPGTGGAHAGPDQGPDDRPAPDDTTATTARSRRPDGSVSDPTIAETLGSHGGAPAP